MLSLILSRIFSICFILAILAGTIAVINQLAGPWEVGQFGNGGRIGFDGGLEVNGTGRNSEDMPADTVIKFEYRDSNNHITVSGMQCVSGPMAGYDKERMNKLFESKKGSTDTRRMDTFYTVMGQFRRGNFTGPSYEVDTTPRVKPGFLPDSGIISRHPLIFADEVSAKRYSSLNSYNFRNKITAESHTTQTLRIQAGDKWEQMSFAVHELVKFGSISFLFLFLSRLFRNFSKKSFFTRVNIRLLRTTGCLMLAPPFVSTLLYIFFLRHMIPVKFVMDQNGDTSSMFTYQVTLDINWMLITVGVSLLVLAWIFDDGLELKEDNLLII